MPLPSPPFAILDFPDGGARGAAQLFARPRDVLVADDWADVRRVLDAVDVGARHGLHAVGFVSYEAAPAFDAALGVRGGSPLPLAWFALFDASSALDEADLGDVGEVAVWTPDVERAEYDREIAKIREGIAAGEYYQVNHTFRLRARGVDPLALFHRLRRAQTGAYSAYLDLGRHAIVSASPELFFTRERSHVLTRPMKGTATRGRWDDEDNARAKLLASSEKERAENVMIVDLVRNDLGRVAQTGSVRVTRLCEVERWPTVLQMTSTVEATLREGVSTFDVFAALFPCGSVTGAPKVAATRALMQSERASRGVYCGAIGHVEPGGRATFNVAIRTAWIDRASGVAEYGAGGGITWDSDASAEYDEALAKARVLTVDAADFELIETMRMEGGTYVRLERHLNRLARSARYFGFADPTAAARRALTDFARPGVWRVRLLVNRRGGLRVEPGEMPSASSEPLQVALAREPVSSTERFLFHKTTHRAVYDRHRAMFPDAFDVLLWNEHGELSEFTIGNLVLEIDGEKWTPPMSCGLLAGVFRDYLLELGAIQERILFKEDVGQASRAWLINSVREWVPVAPAASTPPRLACV